MLAGAEAGTPFLAEIDEVDNLGGLPTQELTESGSNPREVFVAPLQKWFDVRARYLRWTDGRLAQMLIATDITARLRAEGYAAATWSGTSAAPANSQPRKPDRKVPSTTTAASAQPSSRSSALAFQAFRYSW